jgi:hypothetical protein
LNGTTKNVIARALGSRYAPWIVVVLGLALASPALTGGFAADDHIHRLIARDDPGIDGLASRPMDLFVFASGDPRDNAALRDAGVFPWYTDPDVRLAFFRPVTSGSHAVDHALWPDNARAMLVHNLLWLALALAVVWRFYRRFLDVRWIAVLALLLYAVDDARGPVVGWIANRNALIATALAVPALLAYDRWRRDGWAAGAWLGPFLFALALGAGEASLAITAYLGAHALWLDRSPWRARVLALAPYAAITVGWRVVYGALGYGVFGSGVYLDPGGDPLHFAGAASTRLPLLLLGQLGLPWSDLGVLYPLAGAGVVAVMVTFAFGFLLAVGLAAARILRRDPVARFFATGMVLAAVPVASTFPADRLLGFVGLGGMGLVAQLLAAALADRAQLGDGFVRRAAAFVVVVVLVLIHVVLAPPFLVMRSRSMVTIGRMLDRADAGIPSDAAIATRTVILTNPPSDAFGGYIPLMRVSRGQPRPAHMYWLATGSAAVTLERLDDRTLRVAPEDGFLRHEIDRMLRTPARPFTSGERIALTGLTIEIESVSGGRPRTIIARFDRPLDDPHYVWRRWDVYTFVPYTPPPIGRHETLPRIDMMKMLE